MRRLSINIFLLFPTKITDEPNVVYYVGIGTIQGDIYQSFISSPKNPSTRKYI